MGTCKECVFWDITSEEKYKINPCRNENFLYGYHIKDDEIANNQVLVEYDEGWGFFSGPDFGCVHFKEKE